MTAFLVSPESLPATGKLYILDDQSIWADPAKEFGMDLRIVTPLRAEITLFPQEDGVMARGTLVGGVVVPCNRCAEDAPVTVDVTFNSFEAYPPIPDRENGKRGQKKTTVEDDADMDSAVIRINPLTHRVEMDLAALVWQEFSLALPVKPLCDTRCKGLCPECGANRNTEQCDCVTDEGDPRLAKLRNLTLRK